MGKYKYVIWDWNGTLLDDLKINYDAINELLEKRGLPLLESLEQYRDFFGFPIISFYEKAGFDFSKEDFKDTAKDYIEAYYQRFYECDIFPETEGVLREVLALGVDQLIISASEQSGLIKQVEAFGIDHLFSNILGTSDIYAKSKVEIGKAFIKEKGINPKEVLFVGDTTHDFETAEGIGCDCLLVSKGHNSKEKLSLTGAKVIDCIKEIPGIIRES